VCTLYITGRPTDTREASSSSSKEKPGGSNGKGEKLRVETTAGGTKRIASDPSSSKRRSDRRSGRKDGKEGGGKKEKTRRTRYTGTLKVKQQKYGFLANEDIKEKHGILNMWY